MLKTSLVCILLVGVRYCHTETKPDKVEYGVHNEPPGYQKTQNMLKVLSDLLNSKTKEPNNNLIKENVITNNTNTYSQATKNNVVPEQGSIAKISIQYEFPIHNSNCKQAEGVVNFLKLAYNQFSKYCETTGTCHYNVIHQNIPPIYYSHPNLETNSLNTQIKPLPQDNQKNQHDEHQQKLNDLSDLINHIKLLLRKSKNHNPYLSNKDSGAEILYSMIERYMLEFISKLPFVINSDGLHTYNLDEEAKNIISFTSILYSFDSERFENLFKIILTVYHINYNIVNGKIVPIFRELQEDNNRDILYNSKEAPDNNLNNVSIEDIMYLFQKLKEVLITYHPLSLNSAITETKSNTDMQNEHIKNNSVIKTQFNQELLKFLQTQATRNKNANFTQDYSSDTLNLFSPESYQNMQILQEQPQISVKPSPPSQSQDSYQNLGLMNFLNKPIVSPKQSQNSQLTQGSFVLNHPVQFENKASVTPNQSQSSPLNQESFTIQYPVNFQNQPSLSPDQSQNSDLNQGSITIQNQQPLPLNQSTDAQGNQYSPQGNLGNSQTTSSPNQLPNILQLNNDQSSPYYPPPQNNYIAYSQPSLYLSGIPNNQYSNGYSIRRPDYYYPSRPNVPNYFKPSNPLYNYFYLFGHHHYPTSENVDNLSFTYPKLQTNSVLTNNNHNLGASSGSAAALQNYNLKVEGHEHVEENPIKNYLSTLKQKLEESSSQFNTINNVEGKIVELTYALYQPHIIKNRPIYIKYRIPYERLATDISYLNQKLPANFVTDNKDLLEWMNRNATIISAKILEPNEEVIEKQLKIIKDVNSGLGAELNVGNDTVVANPIKFLQQLNTTISESTTADPTGKNNSKEIIPLFYPLTGNLYK